MATNYPTSLDTFVNPVGTDLVATVDHALKHTNANDAILALETKAGITNSADATSTEYRLKYIENNFTHPFLLMGC